MKEIQQKIDQMIIHLGGYWRPLSGLARLLEEVGEVGGALYDEDEAALVEELLDVFVISTCLANQYAIELEDQSNERDEQHVHHEHDPYYAHPLP
jgi:NTP pyrophosphatase (non-canonical NTP hydrolase)